MKMRSCNVVILCLLISVIQAENQHSSIEIRQIFTKINNMQQKLDETSQKQQLQHELQRKDSVIGKLRERVASLETKQKNIIDSGEFVGFFARTNEIRYYNSGDRLIFDDVILDPSNSYNATASAFTCPYSGYYDFKVSVSSARDEDDDSVWKRIDGAIYINGQSLVKAISTENNGNNNYHTQGSISGVFRCEAGHQVYVQQEYGDNKGLFSGAHSLFSGYLIRMDV